jgi:hypothetical protein
MFLQNKWPCLEYFEGNIFSLFVQKWFRKAMKFYQLQNNHNSNMRIILAYKTCMALDAFFPHLFHVFGCIRWIHVDMGYGN